MVSYTMVLDGVESQFDDEKYKQELVLILTYEKVKFLY